MVETRAPSSDVETAQERAVENELVALRSELRQLWREHRLLRSFAEHSSDFIYSLRLTEPVGYDYISPAVVAVLGYTPEECYADPRIGTRLVTREHRAAFEATRDFTIDSGSIIVRARQKSGELIWAEVRWRNVHDGAGRVTAQEGSVRDVTARIKAEENLRQQRAWYMALFEESPLPQMVHELGTLRILEVNAAAVECYGYSRAEVLTFTLAQFYPTMPADAAPLSGSAADLGIRKLRTKNGKDLLVRVFARQVTFQGRTAIHSIGIDVTEQHRAQEELAYRKTLLEAVMQASPDGLLVVSGEKRALAYNQHFIEMWNVDQRALDSGAVDALRQPAVDLVADPTAFLARLENEARVPRWNDEVLLKDGRTFDRRSSPVSGPDGTFYGHVRIFRDVTLRRRESEALRASEARLKTLLGSSNGAVMELDREGRYLNVWANDEQLLMAPAAEIVGKNVRDFFAPDAAEEILQDCRTVIDTGVPKTGESCLVVRGRERWFQMDRFRTPGDTPTMALVKRDITDRVREREALKRSEASFRVLLDTLPDGVLLHRDYQILYGNEVMHSLTGLSQEELVERTVFDIAADDEEGRIKSRVAEMQVREGKLPVREIRVRHTSGAIAIVESSSIQLEFEGKPTILTVLRDRTEHLRMQAQVLQSERMASVGTLAAGVAHEINNPLTFVIANLEFVARELRVAARSGSESSVRELEDAVADALVGSRRVGNIVRDLRTFSRADEETRELLDVSRVLEFSTNMASNEIRHRAKLTKEFHPVPRILANEARLGQVFLNLLINAAQAIPTGDTANNEIRLVIRPGHLGVIVQVSDTGSGIPPELLSRIFDPFFTTKPIGVGTGLGLFITRNNVTALGGRVSVESEVGRGTTFTVELPAAEQTAPAVEPGPPTLPSKRGRILVVDDEEAVCAVLERFLGREHDVASETAARAALARVMRGERFDLILCDVMMPDMTGMDLRAALLQCAPDQARRMVFMTGGAFTSSSEEFFHGQVHRLEKPFDLATVTDVIEKSLAALDEKAR